MQLTVLFWNVHENPIIDRAARIAAGFDVDIVLLAECTSSASELAESVSKARGIKYNPISSPKSKLRVCSRFSGDQLRERYTNLLEAQSKSRFLLRNLANLAGSIL
jgi:hypothetical protein